MNNPGLNQTYRTDEKAYKMPSLCKKLFFTLVIITSTVISGQLSAQNQGRWYSVEVLVFKRLGPETTTAEIWPNDIELSYPSDSRYLTNASSGSLRLLSSGSHKLNGFSYALRKSENYRVLAHKAWRQRMLSEDQSPSIILSGGESVDGHSELEGTIKIHIGRYLHVATDLWLTDTAPTTESNWPRVPSRPGEVSNQLGFDSIAYPVVTLRERRRMRSKEIHYIDHPLMGVFILFTPIGG